MSNILECFIKPAIGQGWDNARDLSPVELSEIFSFIAFNISKFHFIETPSHLADDKTVVLAMTRRVEKISDAIRIMSEEINSGYSIYLYMVVAVEPVDYGDDASDSSDIEDVAKHRFIFRYGIHRVIKT